MLVTYKILGEENLGSAESPQIRSDVFLIWEPRRGPCLAPCPSQGYVHKVGCFGAASNVTGVVTDVDAVTRLLHIHGALAVWDYAAAAPHLRIDMNPAAGPMHTLHLH